MALFIKEISLRSKKSFEGGAHKGITENTYMHMNVYKCAETST